MTEQEQYNGGLMLTGLDGANPLAFLAALGTLRGLTLAWPKRRVYLSWVPQDAWRPCLHLDGGPPGEEEALDGLERFLELRPGHTALEIGDNLAIPADAFRTHAPCCCESCIRPPGRTGSGGFHRLLWLRRRC